MSITRTAQCSTMRAMGWLTYHRLAKQTLRDRDAGRITSQEFMDRMKPLEHWPPLLALVIVRLRKGQR
jgi:hypothetical protein